MVTLAIVLAVLAVPGTKGTAKAPPPAATKAAPAPAPAETKPVEAPPPAAAPVEPPPTVTSAPAPTPSESSSAPSKAEKPRMMVLELVRLGDVPADVGRVISEAATAELARRGVFAVMSQAEMATLLGVERQRELLGCGDSSCFTELAGAVGARFVLSGSIGRLGDAYQLSLQALDTVRAQPLGRATRIAKDLKELTATLPWALAEATATPLPPAPSPILPFGLVGLGAAAAVGGVVLGFQAFSREELMMNELNLSETQAGLQLKPATYYREEAARVQEQKIIAGSLLGVGVALAAVGVWLLPNDGGGARVAIAPTGQGVSIAGVW